LAVSANSAGSICILPRLQGLGGPSSFQKNLIAGLQARGIEAHHDPDRPGCAALLVIGGTRRLDMVWRARRMGIRVVQRLNGMNWIHRLRRTGLRHYLRAEWGNVLLALIRRRLAQRIVYQSQFAQDWWKRAYGEVSASSRVIYNAVDLTMYHPMGKHHRPLDWLRLLVVEGSLGGGYEGGLLNAARLVQSLNQMSDQLAGKSVELQVAGRVPETLQKQVEGILPGKVAWAGVLPRAGIPDLDRSAHLMFSADVNAACPNSVIEALACGLPVAAFESGALPELVANGAGVIAPWGGDPWQLDPPDIQALAERSIEPLTRQDMYRTAARRQAEKCFGLDRMVECYLQELLG